ncbi:hypothetical protein HDV03_004575 [Kappamyces sp. JEL0829]|nr:hypothetical protein HDV03_004575 [Kappamyces sp. JEL0829]
MGFCSKGDACSFIHSNGKSAKVCSFYQKGACSYGQKCLLLHEKPGKVKHKAKSTALPPSVSGSAPSSASGRQPHAASSSYFKIATADELPGYSGRSTKGAGSSARTDLCRFSKQNCKFKDTCRLLHGSECPHCLMPVLHPNDTPQVHEEHMDECKRKQAQLQVSREMECVVCFEKVIQGSKGSFALLSCSHCVCYPCASSWRASERQDNAKTCPICRTISRFVVPSVVWPTTPEEKETIIQNYKDRLSQIDCRVYNKGRGTCPFGTSCFYRHVDENGVAQADKIRLLSDGDYADSGLKVMATVTLFDHLKLE